MQQKLEERQADVEYELRRLFIKQGRLLLCFVFLKLKPSFRFTGRLTYSASLSPTENEWTEDERGEERQLMDELLSLIEQRNQIISSLDQDVQRCGRWALTATGVRIKT